MPDRWGFDHLGDEVRCIDCPTGGPIGRWPDHKRAARARSHHGRADADLRRRRNLLTAPPTTPNEEKEANTMATTSKGEPAKQVAIDILRQAGKPLHAKEIATRVLASGRCAGLKGKTPEATISAMLAVGSKPGGPFKRVDKGTYTLTDSEPTSAPTPPAEAPAPGSKRAEPAKAPTAATPTQADKPPAEARPSERSTPKRQTARRPSAKRTR